MPRKKTGTSWALLPALLIAGLLAPVAAASPVPALRKKPALDTYAILSGSVFSDSGYALPDADVTVAPEAQAGVSPDKGHNDKVKPLEAVSDARGEFVVRVPPGPAHYIVTVVAKGYQSQRKSLNVEDQERVEVTFQLERESK